jgi:hypothetical protein
MKRGQKAWLLIWEWIGDHAAVEDRIAAILRPRLSQNIVGEIVENLYAIHEYSPKELALWSKWPKENPYKAQWYNGHCECGHNPSLNADHVHDLTITEDLETGIETINWVHPPLYRLDPMTLERVLVRDKLRESVTRTITGPLSNREIGRYKPDRI